MKPSIILLFVLSLLPLHAQTNESSKDSVKPAESAAGTDRVSQLMQEYMMHREAWLKLRREALAESKSARTQSERLRAKAKLAEDEQPLLEKMGAAGRAYREALDEKKSAAQTRE